MVIRDATWNNCVIKIQMLRMTQNINGSVELNCSLVSADDAKYLQKSSSRSRPHFRYCSKHRQYCNRLDCYGLFGLASVARPNSYLLGTIKFGRFAMPLCDIYFLIISVPNSFLSRCGKCSMAVICK